MDTNEPLTTSASADAGTPDATTSEWLPSMDTARQMPKPITPAMHAVLDYSVAATFFSAAYMMRHHGRASTLAMLNGAMVLGMSLLTDYPGGVWRNLSFKGHRTGDIGQALLAGLGPVLFGFAHDSEANFFHGQALSELGVIAATDWDAA